MNIIMQMSFPGRTFQLWEYRVGHGSLLIRSPKGANHQTNVDIICVDVLYLAAPRFIKEPEIGEVTPDERTALEAILGKQMKTSSVLILVSEGHRYPIVLAGYRIEENEGEMMDSPFSYP